VALDTPGDLEVEDSDRPAARERARDTRSRFDRFVGFGQSIVSRPSAFAVAVLVVTCWALTYPLFHKAAEWQAVIHSISGVTSLLLLVLLENAGRRADEAAQEKLNVMSEALVVLLEDRAAERGSGPEHDALDEQARMLRTAIGLEERH
jgi:low affinity Fe/Cu permease